MANPVCLVSGSSSGIGATTVKHFARHGYDVVVNYNAGRERGEAIADRIRAEYGTEALLLGADLSQPEAAFELVDQTYAHFGRLDVCISNSGVANYVPDENGNLLRYRFKDTPIDHLEREMERVLSLNLMGAYRLGQRALHYMIEQAEAESNRGESMRHRSILFVTSISDIAPESTRIPYGVSKSGLNHAVLGAALDGGPFNITVNSLRPGVVDTPLTARPSGIHDPADGHEYTVAETYGLMAEGGSQPIRRIGTPEDIAQAAYAFSHIPYMTGQFVAVDGGLTLAGSFANRDVFLQEGLRLREQK
ncbi:MAG: SDR family oxidoreductase [Candidatus Latescibacterota bacterium]|nr:SDR family oxidoreductase [Candidatus Latescibacterota bacterium]MEE2727736.1 SDR family oxidoreductase [Candidatus Latescibacterota bacterium]